MSKQNKKHNYRIFRVEKDKNGNDEFIVMKYFYAENAKDAYDVLKKYRKVANKKYTYYYGSANKFISKASNGKELYFDSFSEMMKHDLKNMPFYKKIIDGIKINWFTVKLDKIKYSIKEIYYLLKTYFNNSYAHNITESYSIDTYLINSLIFNVTKLKNSHHGIPQYCIDAAKKKNPTCEDDTKILEFADEIWKNDLDKLLLYAKLYVYYYNYGIIDPNDDYDLADIDKQYAKTIPYIPGTYKEINYTALNTLIQRYWNKLWSLWMTIGQNCWD